MTAVVETVERGAHAIPAACPFPFEPHSDSCTDRDDTDTPIFAEMVASVDLVPDTPADTP